MVGWTALNPYSNKSSQPKRKLLLFPSGFTPHYYIRIKSQDYNETDNAIALDHFQMRTLCYQNLWKSSRRGWEKATFHFPSPKVSSGQNDLCLSVICHSSTSFKCTPTKLALWQTKWNLLTHMVTHKLSTTLTGFHKGTRTAVSWKLLESSGTKCCDLHKLQNCAHHLSLLLRCKSIHKDLNKSAWGIPCLH